MSDLMRETLADARTKAAMGEKAKAAGESALAASFYDQAAARYEAIGFEGPARACRDLAARP